ncbi:hypothetical protein ACLOJK_004598 [Asimina triloba]
MARHLAPRRALIHLSGYRRRQSLIAPIIERGWRCIRRRGSTSLRGPTALDKEAQERLTRQEEEDLQTSLALSHEEARFSGLLFASTEASASVASLGRCLRPCLWQ